MSKYRTGDWGATIVRVGVQPADASGRRPDDQLSAVVVDGTLTVVERTELAERICTLLNAQEPCPHGWPGGERCGPCSFDRAVPRHAEEPT